MILKKTIMNFLKIELLVKQIKMLDKKEIYELLQIKEKEIVMFLQ